MSVLTQFRSHPNRCTATLLLSAAFGLASTTGVDAATVVRSHEGSPPKGAKGPPSANSGRARHSQVLRGERGRVRASASAVAGRYRLGRTRCELRDSGQRGATHTQVPIVYGFDETTSPDIRTVWFRNRYFFRTAAGWIETAPPSFKANAWYHADVTEYNPPRSWKMLNGTIFDYLDPSQDLFASWYRGYSIKVAQEILWTNPDGSLRDRAYYWTPHLWAVGYEVTSCVF